MSSNVTNGPLPLLDRRTPSNAWVKYPPSLDSLVVWSAWQAASANTPFPTCARPISAWCVTVGSGRLTSRVRYAPPWQASRTSTTGHGKWFR